MANRIDYAELWKLAETLYRSGLFKAYGSAEALMAAMCLGTELGLSPVAGAMGMHVIQGRLTYSARLLQTLIHRAGWTLEWRARTSEQAHLVLTRGEVQQEVIYTIEDAARMGLTGKAQWKQQPRAMLTARALSEAVSSVAADALGGAAIYTEDEVRDFGATPESPPETERPTRQEPAADPIAKAFDALAALGWDEEAVRAEVGDAPNRDALAALYRRAKAGERPTPPDRGVDDQAGDVPWP